MKTKNILSSISTCELKNLSSNINEKNIHNYSNNFYTNYLKPKLKEENVEINVETNYFEKLKEYNTLGIKMFEKFKKKNLLMKIIFSLISLIDFSKKEIPQKEIEPTEEEYKRMTEEICNFIKKANEFEFKCCEYMEEYIIPRLNELAKNKKIVFDRNSNDERVKLITTNTEKKIMKNIKTRAVLNFYTGMLDEEDKKYFDSINFVFNDDIKFKKEFAKGFLDSFVKIYDTLNLDKED